MIIEMSGKTALVTAGSRGLGASIVRQLCAAGADVAFTYAKDTESAKTLEAEMRATGRRSLALLADARDYRRAHEVVDQVIAEWKRLDILVCSAGIAKAASVAKMTEDEWDDVMDISLKGTFNYVNSVAPHFQAQNGGKIVSVGSINGLRGRIGTVSYNVAKAGLVGLVKTAAAELGRFNVNVNLVAPGYIETTTQTNTPELIRDLVLKECAIKRLGQPEDITPLVVFLCSEHSRHITGQTIKIDAGQYL